MGKRTASSTSAPVAKREKLNPVHVEIQDALKQAEHLSANCRAMLSAMVPASFATSREERSEQQATAIQWMENALKREQAKFAAGTDNAAAKLSEMETTKAERLSTVQKEVAALQEKKDNLYLKKNALAEATITMTATRKLLAEQQEEQRTLDADYLAMKKEQEGLAAAFVEHFKVPLEAGESLHYEELQPFLKNLDLEESFMVSAPSSCGKTQAERGSFDNVVLQALQQALLDRASQIKDVVSNRSPESEAREIAVNKSEEQLALDRTTAESAQAELATAQKEVELGNAALKEIQQAFDTFDVEVKAAADFRDQVQSIQKDFEQGPLSSLRTSKNGVAASELLATAGA